MATKSKTQTFATLALICVSTASHAQVYGYANSYTAAIFETDMSGPNLGYSVDYHWAYYNSTPILDGHAVDSSYASYTADSNDSTGWDKAYGTDSPLNWGANSESGGERIRVFNPTPNPETAVFRIVGDPVSKAQGDTIGFGYGTSAFEFKNWSTGDYLFQSAIAYSGYNAFANTGDYSYTEAIDIEVNFDGNNVDTDTKTFYGPSDFVTATNPFDGYYEVAIPADTVYFFFSLEWTSHEAYSLPGSSAPTPAPSAIAPFAIGLIGAIRRRTQTSRR